jgi:hypothetical protein
VRIVAREERCLQVCQAEQLRRLCDDRTAATVSEVKAAVKKCLIIKGERLGGCRGNDLKWLLHPSAARARPHPRASAPSIP